MSHIAIHTRFPYCIRFLPMWILFLWTLIPILLSGSNAVVGAMLGESQPLPLFVPMEDVRSYYQDLSVSYRSGHVCYTPIDEEVDGTLTFTFQVDQDAPVYAEFPDKLLQRLFLVC